MKGKSGRGAERSKWITPQSVDCIITFAFISYKAFRELEQKGVTIYDGITWSLIDRSDVTLHVMADIDRTEMWIKCDDYLPLVLEMRHNPLGIDWTIDE